ncbi:MAG: histidinol-phosphatase HisJ family protein [Coprobacillus sp.]|nr:histidinol-phosphatase HisJ family protein [Coprobacillus sp.]
MFCDYHIHTNYSDDSQYLMEDLVLDALEMKMDEICFTDHVDYGIKKDWDEVEEIEYRDGMPFLNVNYPQYFQEISDLQMKYPNLVMKKGMEFGVQVHTIPQYKTLFSKYPFDFIILSCHQVNNQEFWTQEFQAGKTQKEYNEKYYQELLEIVKEYKDYSVLGHLDLITRYDELGVYDFENIKEIITQILKIVIADGKGIEVNTSSHRYGLNDLTPSRDILKLYKELGGKVITIGSDTHKHEHLGAYILETKKELKKLGFQYYCTFDQMKPIFHQLDEQ